MDTKTKLIITLSAAVVVTGSAALVQAGKYAYLIKLTRDLDSAVKLQRRIITFMMQYLPEDGIEVPEQLAMDMEAFSIMMRNEM